MSKNIVLLLWSLSLLAGKEPIPADCTCLLNKSVNHICYLGALDLNLKPTEQFSLYYDGSIVKMNNGIYCFKEYKDIKKFYFIFINPKSIQFKTDKNNPSSYLSFNDNTAYEFYRLKLTNATDLQNETFVDWAIKKKPMPKQHKNGSLHVVIPNHTIIIPLDAQYFKHDQQIITFAYEALKSKHNVVKLPTPQTASDIDRTKFIEAILQANLCMLNLKNIHTPQELTKIRMDNHTLIQES